MTTAAKRKRRARVHTRDMGRLSTPATIMLGSAACHPSLTGWGRAASCDDRGAGVIVLLLLVAFVCRRGSGSGTAEDALASSSLRA